MSPSSKVKTTVADEAWIAAAMLHREHPKAADFTVQQIRRRAQALGFTRPGVYVHIVQHAVANRAPNPGAHRMLLETGRGRRRLYRLGDACDAKRGGKIAPRAENLPPQWRGLLAWYESWARAAQAAPDPLLELWGKGRHIWKDEPADAYVERLRSDW